MRLHTHKYAYVRLNMFNIRRVPGPLRRVKYYVKQKKNFLTFFSLGPPAAWNANVRFSLGNCRLFAEMCAGPSGRAPRQSTSNHHRAGIPGTVSLDKNNGLAARWWFRSRKTIVSTRGRARTLQTHWFGRLRRLATGRAFSLALSTLEAC